MLSHNYRGLLINGRILTILIFHGGIFLISMKISYLNYLAKKSSQQISIIMISLLKITTMYLRILLYNTVATHTYDGYKSLDEVLK